MFQVYPKNMHNALISSPDSRQRKLYVAHIEIYILKRGIVQLYVNLSGVLDNRQIAAQQSAT